MALLRDEVRSPLRDGREVVVRTAAGRDARAVTELLDEVAAEPEAYVLLLPGQIERREWKRLIHTCRRDAVSLFTVAEIDGRVACVAGLHPDPHPAARHVRQLGMSVRRESRGIGVGAAVIETLIAWASAEGVAKLELGVFPHNERAHAFYRRHGFVDEGVRRAHYARGARLLDEIAMGMVLDEAVASATAGGA